MERVGLTGMPIYTARYVSTTSEIKKSETPEGKVSTIKVYKAIFEVTPRISNPDGTYANQEAFSLAGAGTQGERLNLGLATAALVGQLYQRWYPHQSNTTLKNDASPKKDVLVQRDTLRKALDLQIQAAIASQNWGEVTRLHAEVLKINAGEFDTIAPAPAEEVTPEIAEEVTPE